LEIEGINMKQTITYTEALEKIANLEDYAELDKKLNIFDRSLILSTLFHVNKHATIEDIAEIREKKMKELGRL
jgi:hypothetical protein